MIDFEVDFLMDFQVDFLMDFQVDFSINDQLDWLKMSYYKIKFITIAYPDGRSQSSIKLVPLFAKSEAKPSLKPPPHPQ